MRFEATGVDGASVVAVDRIEDERGHFGRFFCLEDFRAASLPMTVAQANVGFSRQKGTLRGLHYQTAPSLEAKLVMCTRGSVFDVAVDLREDSPTFLRWTGVELSGGDGRMLYVPEGCGHGYLTLAPDSEIIYLTSHAYDPEAAAGIRYDDPSIGVEWPISPTVISESDRTWPYVRGGTTHDHR